MFSKFDKKKKQVVLIMACKMTTFDEKSVNFPFLGSIFWKNIDLKEESKDTSDTVWCCEACTLMNEGVVNECEACNTTRPIYTLQEIKWICDKCSSTNATTAGNHLCRICRNQKKSDIKYNHVGYDVLEKKTIVLIFAGWWCRWSRQLIPMLINWYNKCTVKNIEVVFVSADKDSGQFEQSFKRMPWLAIPFDNDPMSSMSMTLRKFTVNDVPVVTVLGPDGNIITSDAASQIIEGIGEFPWKKINLLERIMSGPLLLPPSPSGESHDSHESYEYTGIYIGNFLLKETQEFTRKLIDFCSTRPSLNIISVPLKDDVHAHAHTMPWKSIPLRDARLDYFRRKHPDQRHTLLILDKNGQIITKNGVEGVNTNPTRFPWRVSDARELSISNVNLLTRFPTLLYVYDASTSTSTSTSISETLNVIEMVSRERDEIKFIVANFKNSVHLLMHLSQVTGAPPLSPGTLCILNLPDGHLFLPHHVNVNVNIDDIREFVDQFLTNRLGLVCHKLFT
jgi:nucleoredoxin